MSKTTVRKGKQDDKFSLAIREIQASSQYNKKCFDCEQRGPTYVNMTIGSFVCTKCSGMLRGINPPHRIKSISMSSFTADEVEMMKVRGNLWCSKVWLATYDKSKHPVDYKDDEKIKEFLIAKYEKKRYYVEGGESSVQPLSPPTQLDNPAGSRGLHSTNLIGSTLKARVDPSSAGGSISVSRPGSIASTGSLGEVGRKGSISGPLPPLSGPVPPLAASSGSSPLPLTAPPTQPPPLAVAPPSASDSIPNFADFDSAAFESLPADPLTTTSAPPLSSVGATASVGSASDKAATTNEGDRYSALKELDDLFKTTTIQSSDSGGLFGGGSGVSSVFPEPVTAPVPASGNSVFPEPAGGPSLFSPGAPASAPISVFPGVSVSAGEGVGVVGSPGHGWGSQPQAWGPSTSPGPGLQAQPWGHSTSPVSQLAGLQGLQSNITPGSSAGLGSGWATDWPSPSSGPANGHSGVSPSGLTSSTTTNPFGNSPSVISAPNNQNFLDNNNDLFAAAPKPFISDKPAVGGVPGSDLNPWMSVPAFTENMKPAHNPYNPFL